jgi:hypothetical protein
MRGRIPSQTSSMSSRPGVDPADARVWERFFNGSTVPGRGSVPRISRNPVDQLSATFTAVIGKPVRTNENGRVRTYSIRNVRALSVCSVEISDVTRLSEPNSPARFWSEEDTQSFSLQSARLRSHRKTARFV